MSDLFGQENKRRRYLTGAEPLPVRMRPKTLEDFVGQEHFIGPGKMLRRMIQADRLSSVIFYGPPGRQNGNNPLVFGDLDSGFPI